MFADLLQEALWVASKSQPGGSSAGTDLGQVPALHGKVELKKGSTNVDIGGGKSDKATKALARRGVKNHVFDPFNRDPKHNAKAASSVKSGKADTATAANVLNVIKDPKARARVIGQAANAVGLDGVAYFSVYEGDGSGIGKTTPKGWQENRKIASYVSEVKRHFKHVEVKGSKIVARQSGPQTEEMKRCTQLSLKAFGISDPSWTKKCVRTGMDVLETLKENGWKWFPVFVEGRPTVKRFLKDHPRGKFVLTSRGHSMAAINGKLWDLTGGSGRHIVTVIVEVYRSGENTIYSPHDKYTVECDETLDSIFEWFVHEDREG